MNYEETKNAVIDIIQYLPLCDGSCFKGANFITPEVISYRKVGKYKVEFSIGTGVFTDYIIGVTVNSECGKTSYLSGCVRIEELIDKINLIMEA